MPFSSLLTLENLSQWREARPAGERLVLTNGCFDLLHVGHVRYLQAARALGDVLLIGVNSDASVRGLKGPDRPVNREQDRAEVLAALGCVDFVVVFGTPTADALIAAARPAVYTKAGDYTLETLPERETLVRLGIETVFVPFQSGYSTTSTLARARS